MPKNYCIISHTHWDREWYLPLENFKLRLVDLMDNLLDILAGDEGYRFHLDAQTIVLEDYLAYRPHKRSLLEKYISEGRILVGPWYVQNDFYLTSGEATVRNLIIGSAIANEFGRNMLIGYAADQFGIISQLPQILRGFGIDNCIFGRGYAFGQPKPLEFIWRAPDGSEVLCEHMAFWYNNAQRFSENTDESVNMLRGIIRNMEPRVKTSNYLLMNGVDHLEAQENLMPIISEMQKRLGLDEYVFQDTMPEFIERVKAELKESGTQLEVYEGELRNGGAWNVLTGTLSSRVYLKQANVRCQRLIENKLEPLWFGATLAGLCDYPLDFDRYLWKKLIENHPHDSICGCSVDAVHRHMVDRFESVTESGEDLADRCAESIGRHIDSTGLDKSQYIVTVFNPTQEKWGGAVEATVQIPLEEDKGTVTLTDANGKPADFTILSREVKEIRILSPINLPGSKTVAEYKLRIWAGEIEGISYKSFIATPAEGGIILPVNETCNTYELDNEFMSVKINTNGTLDVTDKRSGALYSGLMLLEDMEDHGTAYINEEFGAPVTSSRVKAAVEVIEQSRFVQSRRIRFEFAFERDGYKCIPVDINVTLKRGVPYLFTDITVKNDIDNHRLRVHFPTGIDCDENYAGVPFGVVTRPKVSQFSNDKTHPNTDYVGIEDGGRGIAIFNTGLYEYEQLDEDGNPLAITLLRATGRITGGWNERDRIEKCWLTTESQCHGEHTFNLAIYPYAGNRVESRVTSLAVQFGTQPFARTFAVDINKFVGGRPFVQGPGLPGLYYRPLEHPEIVLPREVSCVKLAESVPGAMVFSALKGGEDGERLVVRLYNTSDKQIDFTLDFARELETAALVRMDESIIAPLTVNGSTVCGLSARPGEIVTVAIK
jgi:alpha-mannosidase